MKWPKNTWEEKDCLNRILLAYMNHNSCGVLGLALFLDKWSKDTITTGAFLQWLFAEGKSNRRSELGDVEKEIIREQIQYAAFLKKNIFKSDVNGAFMRETGEGRLATHYIRKFAATYARQCGGTRDDANYRARWKSCRQQEWYTYAQLYWSDII